MNWGWGISIFIFLFIGFMIYMAIKTTTVSHELVTENYYQKELAHQDEIDKVIAFRESGKSILTQIKDGNLLLRFSPTHNFSKLEGKIYMYSPAAISSDDTLNLSCNMDGLMVIRLKSNQSGRCIMSIDYSDSPTDYLFKEELYLP